jgi:UrcA family protein
MTLATLLAAATVAALASGDATIQAVPTTRVRYDDLDLSNSAGVKTLKQRIHLAAIKVCSPRELQRPTAHSSCVQDATERALAQVGLKN